MIVFLGGNNDFAIVQHLQKLRKQYALKYADVLEMVSCDLTDMTIPQLSQQLLATPMFYTHRLVVIHSLADTQIDGPALLEVLAQVPDSTVAVLDGRGMDRRSKLYKSLAALPSAKLYEQLSEVQMVAWVEREAKSLKVQLSRSVAMALVKRVGVRPDTQWRLSQELVKLAAAEGEITLDIIEGMVAVDATSSIFDLIATIRSGPAQAALQQYDTLIASGSSEQHILGTLQWHYRVLTLVHFGATSEELIACNVKPYAASRARQEAAHYSDDDLAQSYQAILDADVAIKSGIKKPHQAMTDLVLGLVTDFKQSI